MYFVFINLRFLCVDIHQCWLHTVNGFLHVFFDTTQSIQLAKDSYQSSLSFLESYTDIPQSEKETDLRECPKSFSFDWQAVNLKGNSISTQYVSIKASTLNG